ncbi:hypothetical protein JTB14_008861 [Gonioctena quinquepunctata]|nr:hypothetical protein JTB14_008861 [Gonioctena quinquepunctata]
MTDTPDEIIHRQHQVEMNETTNITDILVDIPDEHLEVLVEKYIDNRYISCIRSLVRNGRRLRKAGCFFVTFASTRNCWQKDGTFFALMEFPRKYQVAIFTLDDSAKNVYEGLMNTRRIDFRKRLHFDVIPSNVHPSILRVCEEKKLKVSVNSTNCVYTIPRIKAMNFQTTCPDPLKLSKLQVTDSNLMNSIWAHTFPGSEEFVATLIEKYGGYGLYLKSTNELVAWVVKKGLGEMGLLQTVDHQKKKGLASILLKKMSKEIAEDGDDPTIIVVATNTPSRTLMEKLHFENVGPCYDVRVENPTSKL